MSYYSDPYLNYQIIKANSTFHPVRDFVTSYVTSYVSVKAGLALSNALLKKAENRPGREETMRSYSSTDQTGSHRPLF